MLIAGKDEWSDYMTCADCPVRLDVDRAESRNGNVMVVMMGAMFVGALIGFLVGVLL